MLQLRGLGVIGVLLLASCTTVTYPDGTLVTTPYAAPAPAYGYAPVYGVPGYPVPVAPYSPPGTPGAYYGYAGGCAPLLGVGVGWGNWGKWWGGGGGNWNNCNSWNRGTVACTPNAYRINCAPRRYCYGH